MEEKRCRPPLRPDALPPKGGSRLSPHELSLIELPEALHGAKVLLRPYGAGDALPVWEAVLESRTHLAPWLPWVHQYRSPDDAHSFVIRAQARWLLREDLTVGIFDRNSGRYLGGSGLHRIDWALRTFEIGYWLRRTAQGHGFVSETVQLLTRLAFDRLQAHRVEIRVDTRNVRSRRVAERLGFVLEGTLRRCAPGEGGQPADRHIFALIREDYDHLHWA